MERVVSLGCGAAGEMTTSDDFIVLLAMTRGAGRYAAPVVIRGAGGRLQFRWR